MEMNLTDVMLKERSKTQMHTSGCVHLREVQKQNENESPGTGVRRVVTPGVLTEVDHQRGFWVIECSIAWSGGRLHRVRCVRSHEAV